MKLNEIKPVWDRFDTLNEGVIPVHVSLTLDQILRAGKITNNVQYFVLGAMIEMFQNGGPTRWPRDLNAYSMSTDAALIESIKALSDKEAVAVAKWICEALQRPVNFETNPYVGVSSEDYIKWILAGQDN